MIEKVNFVLPRINKLNYNVKSVSASKNVNSASAQLPGMESNSYFKALNNISFKAALQDTDALTELESSFITKDEIRIPNILDLNEKINISRKKMPQGTEHLNAAGLNVEKTTNGNRENYLITNDKGDKIFEGEFYRNGSALPVITYKQGKYMPEITIKDPSLKGKSIKMYAGSIIEGENFKIKMPGTCYPNPSSKKGISFKGNTVITTLNKEPRTLAAVDKYFNSGLQNEAVFGDYADEVAESDPIVVIPAGGFGERFKNITREKENKPSAKMPTDDRYRLIATALNLAASAKIITGTKNDTLTYLSQKHEISGDNVKEVSAYKTDGGAIAEGLKRDIIPNDKDIIILNGDIFTNADISRVYHSLKTLPDAALIIPYYPVDSERAKSFGLLGVENDENGNLLLKSFVEKPKYTSDAPMPNDFNGRGEYDEAMAEWSKVQTARNPKDEDDYLANPGMYFMTPAASKVLMSMGILSPEKTGLGGSVMPKIVELINEGKLLDENGNKLKAYTVPLESKGGQDVVWEDLGTAEAFLSLIRDVANQTQKNGVSPKNKFFGVPEFLLNDFRKNVDLATGIVYDSPEARKALDSFKDKFLVNNIQGNIYIAAA